VIASVRGSVLALSAGAAVIEVGGVGLLVLCSPATLARLRVGEEARLATSLVVRETELTLYGFRDADAKAVFEILQTASGVGPRLAQAVLSVHDPDDVRRAVATADLAALCLVPGVGKKGAQRLVLELADRLGGPTGAAAPARQGAAASVSSQLHAALLGLGYSTREADEGVAAAELTESTDLSALLKAALAVLRRGAAR